VIVEPARPPEPEPGIEASTTFDPAEYSPPEIREQMREEWQKIKGQHKKKP